ncbi:MAG: YggS family pyridoxal phosphate-dependent enzyme [bacterium]|nr:YggS family pyridoxal phosphate-dependent enzyme [bacterium]
MNSSTDVADRLKSVSERMSAACLKAGRCEQAARLVAVSKRISAALVVEACSAGQWLLGENRIPDALDRRPELYNLLEQAGLKPDSLSWHFIGHLQSRKASAVSGKFDLLHGVDSLKLIKKLDQLACAENRKESILLEVNAGLESQKQGVLPDLVPDLVAEISTLKGIDFQGMMTMAAFGANEVTLRQTFSRLRELNEAARQQTGLALPELSMGMSGDFEEAIAEGATLVRVGGAIFGPRNT